MVMFCFILTWGMIISACLTLAHNWKTGFVYVKRLHQVPCHKCAYFTNSCYLKCTVNPDFACSEAAINCRDYQPQ